MTDLIILGWDALDHELVEEFGLSGSFGAHSKGIETYINPVIDEPHTKELWPSMILGETPDQHGLVYADESDGVEWDNDALRLLSKVTTVLIPHKVRYAIGRRLRDRGAELAWHDVAEYDERGLETIFDSVGGRPISIPNYRTERDQRLEMDAGRDELWAELSVDWDEDGHGGRPGVSLDQLWEILGDAIGQRIGQTIASYQAGEPLTWTWFGFLDSVGHINPGISEPIQRRGYEVAAEVTKSIKRHCPDATVVCVSDHGLQGGSHEPYATICSDDESSVEAVDHICDLRGWIEDQPLGGREKHMETTDVDRVQEQLEDLGYV